MPKKIRVNHSPAFKAKVALSAVQEVQTVAELARRYKVHVTQIYKWKREFIENAARAFEAGAGGASADNSEDRETELLRKIGELTVERDFLARGLGRNR